MDKQGKAQPGDRAGLDPALDREPEALPRPVDDDDHQLGRRSAPVELLEYGDYECPYCAQAAAPVRRLTERYGDDLLYVFRHFPLVSQHPHAFRAAVAAEAAGAQGRFWEMHDLLLASQPALGPTDLVQYARAIGLDVPSFESALVDPVLAERVRSDALNGVRSGVLGTPTFFANRRRIEGGLREPELDGAIQAALRSTDARPQER